MTTVTAIRDALWRIVPDALEKDGRSTKEFARTTALTPRAVENIRQRQSLPSAATLIALRRAIPELDAEIRRLETMEAECDPEAERAMVEMLRTGMKLLERRAERHRLKQQGGNGGN
jgi:hypothetical protein